jgi:IS30 family transposase
MPKEPRCLVCADPAAVVAVNELRSQGFSIRNIAQRVKRTPASVNRHLRHTNTQRGDAARSRYRKSFQPKRVAGARCQTCGTLLDDPSPQALVRRAEKVLHFGEQIMAKAIEDEDFRLALQAVDRARASLEQLMKVHGLLQPEGGAGTTIDNRKQVIAVLANLSEEQLRALIVSAAGDRETSLADVTDNRALSTSLPRQPEVEVFG